MMVDVAVIGGGISGLATAYGLMARGLDVNVLERQVTPGGKAISERFGGWLMEHGPTTFNAAFLPSESIVHQLGLDATALPLGPDVRQRYLRDKDRLWGISVHPLGFFLSGYLSTRAKLSLLGEILRPRRTDTGEESLHAFAARRFGPEFAERVLDPMAAGIFMADSRELSVDGAFPRLTEMEARYGSVLRAVLAAKTRRGVDPGRRLSSWGGGVGTLPRTLAQALGPRLRTGVAVTGINRSGSGFTVTTGRHGTIQSRALVLAVPPHVSAGLCETIDPEGAEALSGIAAPPVAVVYMGFHRRQVEHPLDGLGFLSVQNPGQIVSGVQFPSTMFPGRAPQDHVAISAYVGGSRAVDWATRPDAELSSAVLDELRPQLGLRGQPVVTRLRRWPTGLPQYSLGHRARSKAISQAHQRVPGLWVTGNFIDGVAMTSCLSHAAQASEKVCDLLSQAQSGINRSDLDSAATGAGKRTGTD